ncbi:hypothetical protein CWB72_12750 [Pseudoalteromonas phenolica]|uniref:hypothetical protein n=1 Tax=Pseudoalteromonas phenolica TaxID=161398 RepID=UPI00110B4C7E|nr:hypothetical protein [Pseudoalteromonas phenolica]TMN88606.1 hypothetical protein CWB72_12750 [Pseudoalteromonas phenolica]
MSELRFETRSLQLLMAITFFVTTHLLWQHANGGIVSHHLLYSSVLPEVSNWWSMIVLPALTWFVSVNLKSRVVCSQLDKSKVINKVRAVKLAFLVMLLLAALQSISFVIYGLDVLLMCTVMLLVAGLILPIYRAECVLAYVVGNFLVFGAVTPFLIITAIALVSYLSNLVFKPILMNVLNLKAAA